MSEWLWASRALVMVAAEGANVRAILCDAFRREGFAVEEAADDEEALSAIAKGPVRLVILDMGIPKAGGIEVLLALRRTSDVPVILISAVAEQGDRILGLNLGADDYIDRPFSPLEIVARGRAVLRRGAPPRPADRLEFSGLVIDLTERAILVDGEPVNVTRREFDLLAFLASYPRHVFSREQLLDQVWRSSSSWQSPKTVTEHIRRLRLRLDCDPDRPRHLISVRGVGYQFRP
jgi:two-component system phosphate regulon response regulator PhoB